MKVRVKVPGTCGELVQGIKEQNTKLIGEGATISTLANQKILFKSYLNQILSVSKKMGLKLVKRGIKEQNTKLIGEGATISTLANQRVLFNRYLDYVISISKGMGALGVNVAHSGTVIGVLLPPNFSRWNILERNLQRSLNERLTFYRTSLIEGGWKDEIFSWR